MKLFTKIFDNNKRYYQKYDESLLNAAVDEFNKKENKFVLKPYTHNREFINLTDIIGSVDDISYNDNGEYFANIDLLDTPEGLAFQELLYNNVLKFEPYIWIKTKNRVPEKYTIRSIDITNDYTYYPETDYTGSYDDMSSFDDGSFEDSSVDDSSINDVND